MTRENRGGGIQSPELSRPISLNELVDGEVALEVSATPAECAALADRFGIMSVDELSAQVMLKRTFLGEVVVSGRIRSKVTQSCVVTLEPVDQAIDESFSVTFSPAACEGAHVTVGPEDEEPPEPLPAHAIDVGEVVAQQLALAIDPYPRMPGASLDSVYSEVEDGRDEGARSSPFKALATLRRRKSGGS
ncbi:MAG: DUF177 domain-containing protein [Alphaproteobacteria bacterium]